jgi:thiamine-monophosphate kinase
VKVGDLSEADLIARISLRLPPPPDWLAVGIGDDAAVVEPARNRLEVLSVDALVEGVHFDRRFTPADAIGHRALAVNLSDLAAMAAEPRLALLSLVLPADLPCSDFDGMVGGLVSLAKRHRVPIVGGNLTRSPGPLILDVTVAGTVKRRDVLRRNGARAGDLLYVTGSLGAAAAGLDVLRQGIAASATAGRDQEAFGSCVARYLYPEPRIRAGVLVGRNRAASACMDLSDGLADAVTQVAASSGVGAIVDAAAVPVDPRARTWFDGHPAADASGHRMDATLLSVTAGDDYELLFAVPPKREARLRAAARHAGVPFSRIGQCTREKEIVLRGNTGDSPMPRGYKHFA